MRSLGLASEEKLYSFVSVWDGIAEPCMGDIVCISWFGSSPAFVITDIFGDEFICVEVTKNAPSMWEVPSKALQPLFQEAVSVSHL